MDEIRDVSVSRLEWLNQPENMERLIEMGNSKDLVISALALYARGRILLELKPDLEINGSPE